jgi:hypothetical protein
MKRYDIKGWNKRGRRRGCRVDGVVEWWYAIARAAIKMGIMMAYKHDVTT